MSAPRVLLAGGRPLALGDRIGRGGEGEVFALRDRPDLAVKLYTGSKLGERSEKIAAMVQAGLAAKSPLVAFPAQAVIEPSGRFIGFTMRRIVDCKPLFELYAPGARKLAFPKASYRFLVAAAANVARSVAAVHEVNCVIGDINQSGILVSDTALAALIDADSFQFIARGRRFGCRVGVPNYTPPELHGAKLDSVVRTVEHDRFGLAVVLFQLLFMGRHPYAGAYRKGDMPIERAIAEHRFAYSRQRAVGLRPPPGVPTLADILPQVAAAFEAAFAPDAAASRPAAESWVALLVAMEASLGQCADNPLHHYDITARECPWCRMELKQGIALFVPVLAGATMSVTQSRVTANDIAEAWRAIEAVKPPVHATSGLLPAEARPPPSGRALAARRRRLLRRGAGTGGVVAGAAGTFLGWVAWPIGLAGGALALLLLTRDDAEIRRLRREKEDLDRRWMSATTEWQSACNAEPFRRVKLELERARSEYRKLPQREADRIAAYRRSRRDQQCAAYLQQHPVVTDVALGIDRSVAAMLMSQRIVTAADVSPLAFERTPTLPVRIVHQLLAWRTMLERGFVYEKQANALDQTRLGAIRAETARDAATLRATLFAGAKRLTEARRAIEYRRGVVEPQLATLCRRRAEAHADLIAAFGRKRPRISVRWGPSVSRNRRRSIAP